MEKLISHHVPRTEARAAMTSLLVAIVLLIVKFVAYYFTHSTVIFSDAMESIVNVAAAAFAAYALALAHQPADAEHPYGHGKIEFLSAGFEGGMILLAGGIAAYKALESLLHGAQLREERLDIGLTLMIVALIVNACVGLSLIRVGKKNSSLTLEADGWHLMSDAITSMIAATALVIVRFTGWSLVDPVAALIVAAYLVYLGVSLMRRSAAGLMDEQDKNDMKLLQSILDAHIGPAGKEPKICSYHKLRHRHSGRYHWVDFHMMVPAKWDIDTGHKVASSIEYEIEQALGEGNATAHVEPCIDPACKTCVELKNGQ